MGQVPTFPPTGPGSGAYPPATPQLGPGSSGFPLPTPQVAYVVKPRAKWHALRTVAGIFKLLAWITAGFGVIAVLFALITGSQLGNLGIIGALLFAVATAIGVGAAFLLLYSRAEQILVWIAIEENTRKL